MKRPNQDGVNAHTHQGHVMCTTAIPTIEVLKADGIPGNFTVIQMPNWIHVETGEPLKMIFCLN